MATSFFFNASSSFSSFFLQTAVMAVSFSVCKMAVTLSPSSFRKKGFLLSIYAFRHPLGSSFPPLGIAAFSPFSRNLISAIFILIPPLIFPFSKRLSDHITLCFSCNHYFFKKIEIYILLLMQNAQVFDFVHKIPILFSVQH